MTKKFKGQGTHWGKHVQYNTERVLLVYKGLLQVSIKTTNNLSSEKAIGHKQVINRKKKVQPHLSKKCK